MNLGGGRWVLSRAAGPRVIRAQAHTVNSNRSTVNKKFPRLVIAAVVVLKCNFHSRPVVSSPYPRVSFLACPHIPQISLAFSSPSPSPPLKTLDIREVAVKSIFLVAVVSEEARNSASAVHLIEASAPGDGAAAE